MTSHQDNNVMQLIAAETAALLEPNLQFYRKDPSDDNRYFVGPEVLAGIASTATAIGLPVLLCGVNEVVKDRVQRWLKDSRENKTPHIEPPDDLQRELAVVLRSHGAIAITSREVTDATDAIAAFLSYRGWPNVMAKADAAAIVQLIKDKAGKTK